MGSKRSPKLSSFYLILFCFALLVTSGVHSQQKLNPAIESRVTALLNQMTIEEKVGQMAQVSIESLGSSLGERFTFTDKLKDAVVNYKIGSILNTPGPLQSVSDWNRLIAEIQGEASNTRLKIPVLYGLDHIHGLSYVAGATFFPQPIGQAATWNRDLVFNAGVITAYESRAASVPWTFSPALDLGTNPLWSRMWEGYGEDPYLTSELGTRFIRGVQDPLSSKEKIAVSLKHYMAYSDPKSGKDRSDAWIPEHYLREYHLPPFIAAIKAGARTVMVNSALINGIPTHINKHILTDILKTELGFTGFVVSDWQDIENLYRRDKLTPNIKGAIALAINAGNDMSMIPYDYKEFTSDLLALIKEGKVSQARINDAVRRILRVKIELGLFETPTTNLNNYPKFGGEEFHRAAYNTAAESITLLKNTNNILPLKKGAKLLVTGPNANSMRTLNGGWSYTWQGEKTDQYGQQYNTIVEALQKKFGAASVNFQETVAYKMNGRYDEDSVINLPSLSSAAAASDYIILCIGENSYTETPGNLNDLSLSDNQLELARTVYALGKPVIMILNEGRPRIIRKIEPGAGAIVHAYLPGNYGADALVDILAGDINPSGKLPFTYPRFTNALINYIHKPSGGNTNPQGGEFNPQYQFGYGLSYTNFSYQNLSVNATSFTPEQTVTVTVTVSNTGSREGKEVVQLFSSDVIASFTPDVKRLRGFEKVNLKAGESRTISFNVPVKDLAFINPSNKRQVEQGEFVLQIGELKKSINVSRTLIW